MPAQCESEDIKEHCPGYRIIHSPPGEMKMKQCGLMAKILTCFRLCKKGESVRKLFHAREAVFGPLRGFNRDMPAGFLNRVQAFALELPSLHWQVPHPECQIQKDKVHPVEPIEAWS